MKNAKQDIIHYSLLVPHYSLCWILHYASLRSEQQTFLFPKNADTKSRFKFGKFELDFAAQFLFKIKTHIARGFLKLFHCFGFFALPRIEPT